MALFAGRPAEGPAGRVRVNAERLYERLREAGGIGLKEDCALGAEALMRTMIRLGAERGA